MIKRYEVKYLGVLSPRPGIYHGDKAMSPEQVAQRLNELTEALTEAHRVILHELDNGRTPTMLKAEHGGKGLGYFEDVLAGVNRN